MPLTDEQHLERFLEWLASNHPARSVPLLDAYRAHLLETMTEDEARRVIQNNARAMETKPEAWAALFDKIYSDEDSGFEVEPNSLVVAAVRDVDPGAALDVAMGQGRNAVYLAQRGWKATGIDVSPIGVQTAYANARAKGVEIEAICVDHREFDWGVGRWNLMVFTYTPVDLVELDTVGRIRQALMAGGRIVIESFASPAESEPRRPVDLDPDLLRTAFDGFTILRFEDVEEVPDWDSVPQRMVRLIATAP